MTQLVVASNRGPFRYEIDPSGRIVAYPGAGGLIEVIKDALRDRSSVWISAAMTAGDEAKASSPHNMDVEAGQCNRLIVLSQILKEQYYNEISNRTLWFLQHRLAHLSHEEGFDFKFRDAWMGFSKVNDKFAAACAEVAPQNGTVITADYHLSLVPAMLRTQRPDVRICHFTACPWVDPDYLAVLPDSVRRELLSGMLGADLLEFTARRWSDNFLACCSANGYVIDWESRTIVAVDRRLVRVRELAVGVNAEELIKRAESEEVLRGCSTIARDYAGKALIVRVERLDPSKNALRALFAYELLLDSEPRLRGRIELLLHLYSSRTQIPEYREYARRVMRKVIEINVRFGSAEWQPCIFDDDDSPSRGLAALIMADIVIVNSVADAMNLVVKEASVVGRRSPVLILSRTTGAADDLSGGAILINPFDAAELAEAILIGLEMPLSERIARIAECRRGATRMSPTRWLACLLDDFE